MKPLTFGYFSLSGAESAREAGALAWALGEQIKTVARLEGYCLAGVFSDERTQSEAGLHSLRSSLTRGEAVAVIIPELSHLHHAGCLAGADLVTAARYLRTRLIVGGFCAEARVGSVLVREAVGA